jgi:hypothetical protein
MCEFCFRIILASHTDAAGNVTGLDLGTVPNPPLVRVEQGGWTEEDMP